MIRAESFAFIMCERDHADSPVNKSKKHSVEILNFLLDQRLSGLLSAVSAFIMVIYTSILSSYSQQQTEYIKQQTIIQNEQLKKIDEALEKTEKSLEYARSQSNSSIVQANQAIKANEISYSNAIKQLKAYLSFAELTQSGIIPDGFRLKNTGQTPAINVIMHSRIALINDTSVYEKFAHIGFDISTSPPPDKDNTLLGAGLDQGYDLAQYAPNKEYNDFVLSRFTAADIAEFSKGNRILWASGSIFYYDVFNGLNRLRFCMFVYSNKPRRMCETNNDLIVVSQPVSGLK